MESPCIRTENIVEHIARSNRRVRNNKNNSKSTAVTKSNEEKDQENVNNISGSDDVHSDADVSLKVEVTRNNSITELKGTPGSATNLNTSTPRRKKDPLANLYSNLSPKYIGFTTPTGNLNSSSEEKTRNLRRHQIYNKAKDTTSLHKVKDTADTEDTASLDSTIFIPDNEATVGFVRRTPRNKESEQLTPERSTNRKEFVSPIDKLLIKNRAIMENNSSINVVLLDDKEEEDGEREEKAVKKDLMQNEIEEKMKEDLGVKNIESCDKEVVSIYIDDDDEGEDNEVNSTRTKQQIEQNNETDIEEDREFLSNDEEEEDENEGTEDKSELDISTCENNNDDQHEDTETTTLKAETSHSVEEIEKRHVDIVIVERLSDGSESKSKIKSQTPNNESTSEYREIKEKNGKNITRVKTESVDTESNNYYAVDDVTTAANSPSALSLDSAKGSSIVNETPWMTFSTGDLYWGQIYTYCYWPCMVCPDPDGKTITTEEISRTGDQHILVHVRFFADNGRRNWVKRENLIPYTGIEFYQDRIDEVRRRYGVKSAKYKLYVPPKRKESVWYEAVNEANMVAEAIYPKRLEKFYEIFENSKAFHKLEKQRRKSMYSAVNSRRPSDIESSYGSNDNINFLTMSKSKRDRSVSPYSPAYSPIKAVASKKRKLSNVEQRQDDNTATSNAIVTKEVDGNQNNSSELNLSQTNSDVSCTTSISLSDLEIFSTLEFRTFYGVMKDFVMEQNHNEKLETSLVVAVRNIWALKQLSRQQIERKLRESLNNSIDMSTALKVMVNARSNTAEGSVKRLSSRLKTLMVRKSLLSQQTPESTPERSLTPKPTTVEAKAKKPINRPITEVIDDIFELDRKYLFRGMSREPVCKYCLKPSGNLRKCAKNCTYWLHTECLNKDFTQRGKGKRGSKIHHNGRKSNIETPNPTNDITSVSNVTEIEDLPHVTGDVEEEPTSEVLCKECANNEPKKCMVCNNSESRKDDDPLVKCCMAQCERNFHPACCKYWPQAKITISKNHIESFRCPSHVCHTCVSDDPKGKFQHISNAKLTKCVKCPATFHTDSTCIPAGSQILTAAHIICPRHTSIKPDMTVNVNWCFICVKGGQVVCCETCPTAVHAQCLKIPIAANEGYICEECESGRMPLYGEMVWAKFNNFRWWPAIILPPTEIPQNIARKQHNPSDFVVRFFGTHDHGWISRRRVYLYLEGDSSEPPKTKSTLDINYNRGVEEAKQVYEIVKAKQLQQCKSNENKEKLHPQPYVRIKANRAVPPVRLHVDMESVSKCECDPREENPCGPDTNCLNRVLYHECNPKICPAGERCQNQMFESRLSPRLDVVYMKERGFGLVCREPIKAGSFIIEYVGEVINDDEFQARMQQKSQDRDENFYFLSVEKDYIIDAGPKGNLARFMNHSCDPNCETQKWSVNSLNRVGLFSIKDIPENTELTFNYHWDDLLGNEKKECYCGAKKCAGQIGAKLKDLENFKEPSPPRIVGVGKLKSKDRNKPVKKLLNGRRKNKLGDKLRVKVKSRGRKPALAATVRAPLKADTETPSSSSSTASSSNYTVNLAEENNEHQEERNTSRRLESPDVFC